MGSMKKFPGSGLNNWSPDDYPEMEDFSRDNEIIDRELAERATTEWVSAQLSNKVNYNQLGIGDKGANIPQNDCNKIEESGFFRCGPDAVNTLSQYVGIGDPQGEIITSSVWDFNVRAQISIIPNRRMGFRNYWGGVWTPWNQLATAEPSTLSERQMIVDKDLEIIELRRMLTDLDLTVRGGDSSGQGTN